MQVISGSIDLFAIFRFVAVLLHLPVSLVKVGIAISVV